MYDLAYFMTALKEAQVGIHTAEHGLQELIFLAALQLSQLASTLKASLFSCTLHKTKPDVQNAGTHCSVAHLVVGYCRAWGTLAVWARDLQQCYTTS